MTLIMLIIPKTFSPSAPFRVPRTAWSEDRSVRNGSRICNFFWSGPRTRTEPLGPGPIGFGPWIPGSFNCACLPFIPSLGGAINFCSPKHSFDYFALANLAQFIKKTDRPIMCLQILVARVLKSVKFFLAVSN